MSSGVFFNTEILTYLRKLTGLVTKNNRFIDTRCNSHRSLDFSEINSMTSYLYLSIGTTFVNDHTLDDSRIVSGAKDCRVFYKYKYK